MKKLFFANLLGLLCVLGLFSATVANTPEAELDKFMTDYVARLVAVKNEKDDAKAVQMLASMVKEFKPRAEKLKSAYEQWFNALTPAERIAYQERFEQKPYVAELIKIGFDMEFAKRIEVNPAMKKAMAELKLLTETNTKEASFGASLVIAGKQLVLDPLLDSYGSAEEVEGNLMITITGSTLQGEELNLSFYTTGTQPGSYSWEDESFQVTIITAGEEQLYYGTQGTVEIESVRAGIIKGSYSGSVVSGDGSSDKAIPVSGTFTVSMN